MPIIRSAKQMVKRQIPGIRILLYHRVGILNNDPQLLSVTPEHFEEQLGVLRKSFRVMDLEEAMIENKNVSDKEKVIVITFDDGYADNLYQAKPALEKYEMPATVFVVTGQTGSRQEFWWDDLARIFLIQSVLPEQLEIKIKNQSHSWDVESSRFPNSSNLQWNILSPGKLNSRQTVYTEIARIIKSCSYPERKEIIDSIYQWARLDPVGRDDFRVMDENELILLEDGGFIKVGSHTKNHVALSALDEVTQFDEIKQSKHFLEQVLNRRMTLFSYPFGQKKDYNKTTIKVLKRLKFCLACSNFPGRVYSVTDRFQLPRILVRDWDGDSFERMLSGW